MKFHYSTVVKTETGFGDFKEYHLQSVVITVSCFPFMVRLSSKYRYGLLSINAVVVRPGSSSWLGFWLACNF